MRFPTDRAALILTEVLGWSAAEAAECLEMSVPALNSALQRARATLASRNVSLAPADKQHLDEEASALLDKYVEAFQMYDVDALVSLLREDVTLSMPPFSFWLQGPAAIRAWLMGRGNGCRGSKLIPIAASGGPAFGGHHPGALERQDRGVEYVPRHRTALSSFWFADASGDR